MAITPKSGIIIPRRKVNGMEPAWTKMWDPPEASPATPDLVTPTNPVPAFMEATLPGYGPVVPGTVNLELQHGLTLDTWDIATSGKQLFFMTFRDNDSGINGFPGPTLRVPRGKVFHAITAGKGTPPHTIHWHGLEPTPLSDGVGHCSMEIGQYIYQLQPNFIGTYFYHCHRNTVQHFEFGLYGMLLVEPPDAYDNPATAGGYPRRTAANLAKFSKFSDRFVSGDPVFGVADAIDLGVGDPHAFTVEYDREALWVFDDRDSVWSDLAQNRKAFYPGGASTQDGHLATEVQALGGLPGVPVTRPGWDDQFPHGFFHDYNADYWFVTGVPVPAHRGETGTIPTGIVVPPELNSGVTGMQVDVNAGIDEVVLVRCLNGAYNAVEVTFPIDVTIIAFDGRALGVPPFGRYNQAFELKANTPYRLSTARRFDALIRHSSAFSGFATINAYDTRGLTNPASKPPLVTTRIPINIA